MRYLGKNIILLWNGVFDKRAIRYKMIWSPGAVVLGGD